MYAIRSYYDGAVGTPENGIARVGRAHVGVVAVERGARRARAALTGLVITSYSIHYTKLYESPLHTVESAHEEPLATFDVRQPAIGSPVSVVQTLPSWQWGGVPAGQTAILWEGNEPGETRTLTYGELHEQVS